MCGIKIPQYKFALKMQGGGAYLRDTTVHTYMHTCERGLTKLIISLTLRNMHRQSVLMIDPTGSELEEHMKSTNMLLSKLRKYCWT